MILQILIFHTYKTVHIHYKRKPCHPTIRTQIDKAHHHIRVIEKVGVLRGGQRRALTGQGRRAVRLLRRARVSMWNHRGAFTRFPRERLPQYRVLFLGRHRVVQVQHEERCRRRLFTRGEGPGTVRQAQDGEDFSLDLSPLVVTQPPVNKARMHMVVS